MLKPRSGRHGQHDVGSTGCRIRVASKHCAAFVLLDSKKSMHSNAVTKEGMAHLQKYPTSAVHHATHFLLKHIAYTQEKVDEAVIASDPIYTAMKRTKQLEWITNFVTSGQFSQKGCQDFRDMALTRIRDYEKALGKQTGRQAGGHSCRHCGGE